MDRALMTALLIAVTAAAGWPAARLAGNDVETRAALARSQEPASRPSPIFLDETAFTADISADGQFAVLVIHPFGRGTREAPSRLEIRNLQTKTTRILSGGPSPAGTPGRPAAVFSADARFVAYSWLDTTLTGTGMLQVIANADGAVPRTLIPADASDRGIVPHGWSPDGRRILVLIHGASDTMLTEPTTIAWVSVDDGRIQTIKVLEPWREGAAAVAQPRLSPDGTLITYSAVAKQGSADRSIYVVNSDGSNSRELVTLPGSSTSPVWTPDSARIVFVHTRDSRSDLFAATVQPPSAQVVRVHTGFPADPVPAQPISISRAGGFYYRQFGGGLYGIVVERTSATPRMVETVSGYGLAWSRQDRLGYIRRDRELVVRSLANGVERVYEHSIIPILPPRMLHASTGAVLYIPASGDGGRAGGAFYVVELESGTFRRLFAKDTADTVRSTAAALAPDDKTLYVGAMAAGQSAWSSIVGLDLQTGADRPVLRFPGAGLAGAGLAVSPDGRSLAIHGADGRILTADIDGRNLRELCGPSPGGAARDLLRWTPDGQSIVFVDRDEGAPSRWRLLKVPLTSCRTQSDGLDSTMVPHAGPVTDIDLSPDGSRLSLSIRAPATFDVSMLQKVPGFSARPRE